jgi:hypothetical protein
MKVDVAEHAVDEGYEWSKNVENGGKKMSTAPGIPRRSPIQVLTGLDVA